MSLFRPEVLEYRRLRLHGDVMLTRSTSSWVLTGLLCGIIAAVALWIAAGHYARTEMTLGRIVPDGAMTRIMPSRAGIVTSLAVKEGQLVQAGQPLATIMVEQANADRSDPTGSSLQSIDEQGALIGRQIGLSQQNVAGEADKLRAAIAQYQGQLQAVASQITLQIGVVQSAKASFEPLEAVMQKGYYSRIQYEQRHQQYLGAQQQLAQLQASQAQLTGQLRTAEASLAQLPVQAASRVTDLETSRASLLQKRIEVESSRSYVVRAPVAGRVSSLQIAQGSTIVSSVPLMTIVGEGSRMMAELYAPSRAIGFAHQGQEVRLMYDAFPFQRFGSFGGRIVSISRTVLGPNEIDAALPIKEPVYRLRVAVPDQTIAGYGEVVPLQPGMTLTANIVLDRRSFLDWLLEPIRAVRNRT